MDLVQFLEASLRERDWTQSRLADEAKVSRQAVSAWLAGELLPNSKSCEKIAAALDQDPDYILELAGHRRPRGPQEQVDARRQVIRDQLDRWITAVGPEYEEYFWSHLKAQGNASVDLIRQLRTAVNEGGVLPVNSPVTTEQPRPKRPPRRRGGGSLSADQRAASEPLDLDGHLVKELCAA